VLVLEEVARVHYLHKEYQECINYNNKAILLKQGATDLNYADIGLCYMKMDELTQAAESL